MRQFIVVFRRAGTEHWYAMESNRRLVTFDEGIAVLNRLYASGPVAATQFALARLEVVTVPVRANIVPFSEAVVSL